MEKHCGTDKALLDCKIVLALPLRFLQASGSALPIKILQGHEVPALNLNVQGWVPSFTAAPS